MDGLFAYHGLDIYGVSDLVPLAGCTRTTAVDLISEVFALLKELTSLSVFIRLLAA